MCTYRVFCGCQVVKQKGNKSESMQGGIVGKGFRPRNCRKAWEGPRHLAGRRSKCAIQAPGQLCLQPAWAQPQESQGLRGSQPLRQFCLQLGVDDRTQACEQRTDASQKVGIPPPLMQLLLLRVRGRRGAAWAGPAPRRRGRAVFRRCGSRGARLALEEGVGKVDEAHTHLGALWRGGAALVEHQHCGQGGKDRRSQCLSLF